MKRCQIYKRKWKWKWKFKWKKNRLNENQCRNKLASYTILKARRMYNCFQEGPSNQIISG
jgi:hypothetical protein